MNVKDEDYEMLLTVKSLSSTDLELSVYSTNETSTLSILIDSQEADIEVFLSKEDEAKLLDALHKRWTERQ